MAASINITISDANLSSVELAALRDTGNRGQQHALVLKSYLNEVFSVRPAAGITRVSTTAPVRAVGVITMTDVPTANDTVTIGATVFTWKASAAAEGEVTIGAGEEAAGDNLAAKIIAHSVAGKLFTATSNGAGVVTVTCLVPGLIGNGIRFAESSDNLTMNGSGYLGATTAGAGNDDATLLRWKVHGGTLF